MKDKLSLLVCGFRERYSTQHALIRWLDAFCKCLDSRRIMAIVLVDLAEVYYCLPHDLLFAKLAAYGFLTGSSIVLHSYEILDLSNRNIV